MTRILVVGPSWIGDTILAQPLFRLLHSKHRDLALDVLAPEWTLPLLRRMPEVRRAILNPFAHGELKLGARRRLGRELRGAGYDQAIVLPNSYKSALVPFFAGIPLRTGFRGEVRWGLLNDVRRLDERALPLMAQRYAALAGRAGEPPVPLPDLRLNVDTNARAATLLKLGLDTQQPAVALCPGAEYGPAKRWPPAHYAELGQRLAARGLAVWLVGSSRDQALGGDIATLSEGVCRNLCGTTTLDEVIDVLASAEIVVSNDSGLMHVAAALGKPLVALYGSSSPAFTPPLSSAAKILKLDLPCSPCFERECPLGHFNCMMQLTPERVFAAIEFGKIQQRPGK
ncbi:MAG: lipopolysaccharide heptosyltransferase II [Betaproteobacteria bacterium]|nr:lipopolysaccharide heptosyltransferase II [Betaproteobacteria bacterium]